MKRGKLKIYPFALALSGLILVGCGREELPEKDFQGPVAVRTAAVTMKPVENRLVYSGTVEPIERAELATKMMGWVETIYVEEGEAVTKGTVLVRLRSEELEAKRAQAEAAIAEAEARFKNVGINLKRIESLYQKKAATRKELDDIRTAFAAAEARRKAAVKMKEEVDGLLRYTALSAPFDGVVARKMVDVGDLASPGRPVMIVDNLSRVKVVAKVPEGEINSVAVGMAINVEVGSLGKDGRPNTRPGKISQIVPSTEPGSRQFDVKVVLDNRDRKLKAGMFARITAPTGGSPALVVPQSAVFRRGQLEGLFVVDPEGRARLRWVRTGASFDAEVEILSGVNAGETVIIDPSASLVDGVAVEVTQ